MFAWRRRFGKSSKFRQVPLQSELARKPASSRTARPVRFRREPEEDWDPRERLAVARPELAFLKRQSLTLEFSFDCRIHRRFRKDETELPPDVSQ
jgi:hypothetical protein